MTDRERLIDGKEYARQMRENAVKDENGIVRVSIELWEQIADIIEHSIVPPCKVGDKVWWLTTANWQQTEWKIVEVKVSAIQQKADKSWKIRITHNSSVWEFKVEDIGIRYFLTKEEAEDKLRERNSENVSL